MMTYHQQLLKEIKVSPSLSLPPFLPPFLSLLCSLFLVFASKCEVLVSQVSFVHA